MGVGGVEQDHVFDRFWCIEAKVCVVSITQTFRVDVPRLRSLSEAEIDAWLKTARAPTYGARGRPDYLYDMPSVYGKSAMILYLCTNPYI